MSEIEIFERMVGVDIMGTWRCCREVEPYMREGGCILTTGGDRAVDGAPGCPIRCMPSAKEQSCPLHAVWLWSLPRVYG